MNSTTPRTPTTPSAPFRLARVYRQVTFDVATFDRLKDWQRHLESTEWRSFTNGEVLDRIIPACPST